MTIFLPIKLSPTGGTSSFARKLQAGMAARGHQVVFNYQRDYDVLLCSPSAPLRHLLDAKRRHKPIIQRLDGVYYPTTTTGWFYPLHNAPLALIRHVFADVTIYQSNYSRQCCDRFLGKSHAPSHTIYNGVDTKRFSPDGPRENMRDNPGQQVFITASRFRRPDQIIPVTHAFKLYRQNYHANSKLVIVGNFTGRVHAFPAQHAGDPRIKFVGIVPNEQLPQYLRAADAFLFTHLNPPCPNNILEAMACGLPVCGVADGAMTELVTSGREGELIPARGEAFYRPRDYDTDELARCMDHIVKSRATYAAACRQRAVTHFDLNTMINKYLNVIESVQ